MKASLSISICLLCGIGCMVGVSVTPAAAAGLHPRAAQTTAGVEKSPPMISRLRPISSPGILVLNGTAANGVYHGNSVALGKLIKPSGGTQTVLSGTAFGRRH